MVRVLRFCRISAVVLACMSWILPVQLLAAAGPLRSTGPEPAGRPMVGDVALGPGGQLRGQVIDAGGNPLAGQSIAISRAGQIVGHAVTDEGGRFTVAGLRGGLYHISTANGAGVYRLWTASAAPPVASEVLVLVAGENILRGQEPGGLGDFLLSPQGFILAGIIAAAIAIPIAIHNARNEQPPGS